MYIHIHRYTHICIHLHSNSSIHIYVYILEYPHIDIYHIYLCMYVHTRFIFLSICNIESETHTQLYGPIYIYSNICLYM